MAKVQSRRISDQIKSRRMRNVFSQKYDASYTQSRTNQEIDKDIQYLRNTLYRSKKAFQKKGLGNKTDEYFDIALKNIRNNKSMSKQEKAEMLQAAVKYTREHRLTASLFEAQKQLTLESLNSNEFSSVIRQSKEMDNKRMLSLKDLTDVELYQVFEALESIRNSIGQYEKSTDQGSGDEFDAAIEVVYSMHHDNGDWNYNNNRSLSDNILDYLHDAKKKVSERTFKL